MIDFMKVRLLGAGNFVFFCLQTVTTAGFNTTWYLNDLKIEGKKNTIEDWNTRLELMNRSIRPIKKKVFIVILCFKE